MSKNKVEKSGNKMKRSASPHNFPVVGIGASAGGLDAFKKLLEAIPEDSGMAYVLVQHLSPAHESNLTEILARAAKIPIEEITNEVKISPNHIYVMPSGKILTSVDGVLKLAPRNSVKTNLVIDYFFTSLAGTEEMEAANEELPSANEKLQSSNEEMQSLNKVNTRKEIEVSEKCFAKIIHQSPFAFAILKGKNMVISLANDTIKQIWGKGKEVEGKPLFDLLPELRESVFPKLLDDVYTTGIPHLENEILAKLEHNGVLKDMYFNLVYQPFLDADDTILGVAIIAVEVTGQVNAKKQIEASEQDLKRYKHMADNANEPFILMREDGTFAYLNDLALQRWGYTKEEAQHIRVPDVDTIYNDEVFKAAFAKSQTEKIPQFETLHKKKDGTIYPVEINMGGFTLEGKPHMFAIARDITERKKLEKAVRENEEKIRSFILQAPVAMCLYRGPQHIIEIVNEELLTIWDKPLESVINKPVFDAMPGARGQGFEALLEKVYTTGEKFSAFGIPIELIKDGKPRIIYINLVYQPYREVDGVISGIVEVVSDVTEQVKATQLIQASEQRLSEERMVLYNSFMDAPAGISILKGDSLVYEFVNAEYEKLFDRKITFGKTVQELFPEAEQQGLIDILNNVFSTGKPFIANEFPVKLINKNTDKLDLHYYTSVIQPMKDEKGNIERLLTHGVEVTQQVEARKQIEEANKQLRTAATVTENIADAVVGTDMDYKTISWNKGAENLYGYSSEEVMGNYAMALLCTQFLSEEDKQAWSKALDATGKWQGEVVQSKKDGTLVSVLVSIAYVYDEKGKPIAAFAVNRDITDRKNAEEKIKESEAKFRTLSETIPHMIWTAAPDGKKNFYNKYFFEYTGLSFEELKDDGMLKIIFPEDIKKDLELWHHSLKTGENFIMEKRLRHHDGTYRWHLSHAIAQKDMQGNIIGWIGSSTEIEEQKMKEKQKDEFIAIAGHEMKTPLTIAKTYLHLLEMQLDEGAGEIKLFAKKANDSVEKLNQLIGELVDVSKIQEGKINYNLAPFNFNKLLDETMENMQIGAKNHHLKKSGNISHEVTGDKDRLQQVLINLLTNAIKYSPNANEVLVNVEEKENMIQVAVKDFGIGMNKQHLEKIFERYYRIQEHTMNFQGLGIGLYISYNIIIRHGGTMWAESDIGRGSTFYFTIPT